MTTKTNTKNYRLIYHHSGDNHECCDMLTNCTLAEAVEHALNHKSPMECVYIDVDIWCDYEPVGIVTEDGEFVSERECF